MPLPAAYYWIDSEDGSYLRWNASTVAYVEPEGWRWRTTINWGNRQHTAVAGSLAQGKRWIERWVTGKRGPRTIRR